MSQRSAMSPTGRKNKVRKGTHSCRECRRRKVRCRFAKPDDIVCVTCTARGTSCYSQESINPSASRLPQKHQQDGEVMDRLQRLEAAMESLIGEIRLSRETSGMHFTSTTEFANRLPVSYKSPAINDILVGRTVEETPTAAIFSIRDMLDQHSRGSSASYQRLNINKLTTSFQDRRQKDVCKILFSLFPSQQVMSDLVSASPGSNFVSTFFHSPHEISQGNFQKPTDLAIRPQEDSNPIVLAKRLLQLMICVQHLQPGCNSLTLETRESLKKSAENVVSIVSEVVHSTDDTCVSLQGLECLLLLAIFQLNAGNLRRSWLTVRRALNISQILGLDNGTITSLQKFDKRMSPEANNSHRWLWHRVTFFDRYLSLLLGLPPGTKEDPFANLPDSEHYTPMDSLERNYTVLTGFIIERNSIKSSNEAFASTQLIDCKLDAAAEEMGTDWWEPTRLHMAGSTFEKISSISKTLLQIHHYTLKVFLHLPHLFQRESGLRSHNPRFKYSRDICATASRSILRLFIPYRNLNSSATACRHVDHSALIGAMTLLMAYLADEPPHTEESLTPTTQRQEDSRLLESVQARFQVLARENEDAICHEASEVISRLMPIVTWPEKSALEGHGDQISQNTPPVKLDVPYIGVITIKPWVLDATRINIERPVSSSIQGWVPELNVTNDENEPQGADYFSTQQISAFQDVPTTATSSSTLISLNDDPIVTTESSMFPNVAADMMEWSLQGIDTNFWNLVQEGIEPEVFL
ncbi:hypothetical protein N7481_000298 [Penicillium waksmanii]|uniref:uncharacterized protein n=1 Tax=Penicillium waksmanii TaxID=69791 RepID=UPI0025476128|nr:uncharacterized protein N7481_000298 [Penicillium waksmanii]KAJ5999889.1 hypothetical protein N7481_000298 [Penicillium waksmanii]